LSHHENGQFYNSMYHVDDRRRETTMNTSLL